MSFLPALMMIGGTAVSAIGSIQQGNAEASAAKANANVLNMQADATRQSGAYTEQQILRQKNQTLARQRALYAKAGVLINEGSPLEVQADSAVQAEMDLNANRYNTNVQANQYGYESQIQSQMAKSYRNQGYMKAAGSTLLTAGQMYSPKAS